MNSVPVDSGAKNTYIPGSYTVTYTYVEGYTGSISGDCTINGNVNLKDKDDKTCVVTLNDEAGGNAVTEEDERMPCNIFEQPNGKTISVEDLTYTVIGSKPGCGLRIENFGNGNLVTPIWFYLVSAIYLPEYTHGNQDDAWQLTFDVSKLNKDNLGDFTKVRLLPLKSHLQSGTDFPIRIVK